MGISLRQHLAILATSGGLGLLGFSCSDAGGSGLAASGDTTAGPGQMPGVGGSVTGSMGSGGGTAASTASGGRTMVPVPSTPDATGGAAAVSTETGGDTAVSTATGGDTAVADGTGGEAEGTGGAAAELDNFSFFVTSLEAMQRLSGSADGFGGDLRYGEADGLTGADKICTEIAETSMPGSTAKQWRAFLSVNAGPDGSQVDAIDRIGSGPWYDRLGRLVAQNLSGLLRERPAADPEIVDDLPNEYGEPNHYAGGVELDNHDVLTGSDESGELSGETCSDWTSAESTATTIGRGGFGAGPIVGHSWPAQSGQHWINAHGAPGCAPSVVTGEGSFGGGGVGDMGGYGAIYCFALTP